MLDGLSGIETAVGHWVLDADDESLNHLAPQHVLLWHDSTQVRDCPDGSHAVKVVGVGAQLHDRGNQIDGSPIDAKHLGEVLEVLRCSCADGVDWCVCIYK